MSFTFLVFFELKKTKIKPYNNNFKTKQMYSMLERYIITYNRIFTFFHSFQLNFSFTHPITEKASCIACFELKTIKKNVKKL